MVLVSGGELKRALQVGFRPQKMIFSGVGKTQEELLQAMECGVLQVNVESEPELHRIARLAKTKGICINLALRMSPDVNPQNHP